MSVMAAAQDKVNISVAIIPMAQDFGWSPTVAGLVQSSFFYGAPLALVLRMPGISLGTLVCCQALPVHLSSNSRLCGVT